MAIWKRGEYQGLLEDTLRAMESSLSKARGATTPEQRAKVFGTKVRGGNRRAAVRYITDREGGGVLAPDEINDKLGKSVIDDLRDKHPPMRETGEAAMYTYNTTPSLIDLDITEDTVESVASKISGSAGLSGMDSVQLKHLLLQHGGASKFGDALLPNACPSAKDACGSDQLKGVIHGMSQLWEESEALDHWGFLLVDAKNAFNELNRINILWTIRHEWPADPR